MSDAGDPGETLQLSDDVFLGGRLKLLQPSGGYRAGLDAVVLAAAAPVAIGRLRVLDAGAGVGTVGLALASRVMDADITLVEKAPALAGIAMRNVERNGLSGRVRVLVADVCDPADRLAAAGLTPEAYDHVLANPPYLAEDRVRLPADALKAGSHAMPPDDLERWARFAARMAVPGGAFTLIHRADALGTILSVLDRRFGDIRVVPLHPRAGVAAHRVLVSGRKGSRAPLELRPGVVLHGDGNRFLPPIESVLRDGAPLDVL